MIQPNISKNAKQFTCEKCNFICSKQSNYNTHLQTRKHQTIQNDSKKVSNGTYSCICGLAYKHSSGYYRHKKTCTFVPSAAPSDSQSTLDIQETDTQKTEPNWIEMIQILMKENQEIRNFMVAQHNTIIEQNKKLNEHNLAVVEQNKTLTELVKNQQPTTNNSHNNNTIYNINMFLSEKCKDAKNMNDFIEVLKTKVDMFQIEENGYVDGISKLFIQELNSMEVTERPLHCTDERRNTFYVHNNDTWNKDQDLKDTKKAINHVSHANLQQCLAWSMKVPPGGADREEHINRSIRLCKEANKSSDDGKVDKIIKNISKEIPLNKQVINDV